MKQFGTLFRYEMKKILCRKSTWISLAVIVAFYLLSELLIFGTVSQDSTAVSSHGQVSEEEGRTETYAQAIARQRRDGLSWSGKKLDDNLMEEMKEEWGELNSSDITMQKYSDAMDRYQLVCYYLSALTGEGESYRYLEHMDGLNQEDIYKARQESVSSKWKEYALSKGEMEYWQAKENALSKPFTIQYSAGFDNLLTTQGIYLALMLVSFFVAVTVSEVFAQEHVRKTDQLILCSRLGRKQLYFAKMLAGIVFTLISALFFTGIIVASSLTMYGPEGFSAAIQWKAGWYSDSLTIGNVVLVLIGTELIAAVVTGIFAMVISEGARSSLIAMAVIVGGTFAARLIVIPNAYRLLSQLWGLFPINQIYFFNGFVDLRLISVFGIKLTSWQFAPVLYLAVGILLMLVGKRLYCHYQVEG